MIHSDDQGLVLPPPVAEIQVVVVPINYGKNRNIPESFINQLVTELQKKKIRVSIFYVAKMRI